MFLDRREHRSRSFSYAYMQLHALHDGNFRRMKCILRQTQQKDRRPRTDIKVSRRKSPLCCLIDRSVRRIITRCDGSNAISIAMVQKHQKIQPSLWEWSCEKWRTEGRKRDREAEIFGDKEMSFSQTVTDINWQLDRQLLPLLFSFLFQSRTELVFSGKYMHISTNDFYWSLFSQMLRYRTRPPLFDRFCCAFYLGLGHPIQRMSGYHALELVYDPRMLEKEESYIQSPTHIHIRSYTLWDYTR